MIQIRIRLLGGYAVEVDGRPIPREAWRHRRGAELVKLLALAPRRRLHREQVIETLWPDLGLAAAAANLHKAAHFARRALGARYAVVLRGEHVELWPGAAVATDAERFETEAKEALATGDAVECRAAALLYRRELLPDEPYEDWAAVPREYLRRLLLDLLRQAGRWEQVLAHVPTDEAAHRELMRDYGRRGNRVAAFYQYEHLRKVLNEELGLEPSAESVAVYREISLAAVAALPPRPPIDYVRSGDVSIAYQVVGEGPVDLLMIPGWVSHLALDWEEPTWVRWSERMTSFARLIRFDKRGTGLSDRPPGVQLLEERMEDARAVLDAVGIERAHVLGWSEGGPLAILLAVTYPERVESLTLYGTQACFRLSEDYPWGQLEVDADGYLAEIERGWGELAFASYFAPGGDERFARQWSAYQRAGASPAAAAALSRANREIDVRPLLSELDVPTLVLSRYGDSVGPPDAGRYLAARIHRARFVELPGDDHIMWLGDTEALCSEIERFIVSRPGQAAGAA